MLIRLASTGGGFGAQRWEQLRRYGDPPKCHRVDGLVSGQRRPRTSLLAARIEGRLEEPLLFEGTCDTAVFNTWLKTRLCPRLTAQHLVIMDNAVFHKAGSSSRPPVPRCCSCRRTLPPSTRSNRTSPPSRNAGSIRTRRPSTKSPRPINNYRLSYIGPVVPQSRGNTIRTRTRKTTGS